MGEEFHRVGELARRAGVSVRTLHHYDESGLLRPTRRSAKGYRLYDRADVLRLQQIVIRRALGMSLEHIRRSLDDPAFSLREALVEQRARLERRRADTEGMLRSIDATLATLDDEDTMNFADMFDGFEPDAHAKEAEQRWGATQAWAESTRRTRDYGPQDWAAIKAEATAINQALADKLRAGVDASDPSVTALAERHRLHIDRWFYPCAPSLHVGLGHMYVADPRFAAHYERVAEGLAAYLCAVIEENAERGGASADAPAQGS